MAAVVAWLAALVLLGYGTHSLFYATPWHDPLPFLSNLALIATGGALSLAGPFPIDLVVAIPSLRLAFVGLGLALGGALWIWIARTLRLRPAAEHRASRGLALWMVLFLLPQAAAAPGDRLLFVSSIGACGLLAQHLSTLRERARAGQLGTGARWAAGALLLASTLGSGLLLLGQGVGMALLAKHLRTSALATDVGPTGDSWVQMMVLQTESQMQGFTLGATWNGAGGDPTVRFNLLQNGPRPLRFRRLSETDFELESLGTPFLDGPFERVYLAREPALDEAWQTSLFAVRALLHPSGELRRLHFSMVRSLDDPSQRFVVPRNGVLTRIRPPAVGAELELPAPVPVTPLVP